MTTLLNTLFSEKGELFVIGHGRLVLFARCKPEIRIYEKTTQVPLLGESGCKKKSMRFTIKGFISITYLFWRSTRPADGNLN